MAIVGGLDLHRKQITYDVVDTQTGQLRRGRIVSAERGAVRDWLGRFAGEAVELAVEAGTGWRFVVESASGRARWRIWPSRPRSPAAGDVRKEPKPIVWTLPGCASCSKTGGYRSPGFLRHTCSKSGRRHDCMDLDGGTDRLDATHPRGAVSPWRASSEPDELDPRPETDARRRATESLGRESIAVALRVIDTLEAEAERLHQRLVRFAGKQPGCRALQREYGIGKLTSAVIWCELGDARRFSSSDDSVRHSGLDISIYSSDGKRSPGKITRQGPPLLRWALYEAARCAARPTSPDHHYHQRVARRLGAKRANLSVARKLVRRCHHRLRELGDDAMTDIGT